MRSRFAVTLLSASLAALAVAVVVSAQRGSTSATLNDSFFAALAGKNERPKADPNGRGSFAATLDGSRLCYGYAVKNIGKPAAAHIHRGPAGRNGPIVATLKVPASGDPGVVSGCVRIGLALKQTLFGRPSGLYVNVHNPAFPGGAVRGQLFARAP